MNGIGHPEKYEESIRILLALAAGAEPADLPGHWPVALTILADADTRFWNRLIIPIYATIKHHFGISTIPSRQRPIIQRKFMELLGVQIRQDYWLKKLVSVTAKAELPIILLKGSAATGTLYDERYSRVSQDIDLLVEKRELHRLIKVIESFAAERPVNMNRLFSERHSHERNLPIETGMAFNIEPHVDLNPRYSFSIDNQDLWASSTEHPLFKSPYIRMLSDEHALVYMATHSFFHMEYEPHHLVDAMRHISRRQPDVRRAIACSKEWGCSTILFLLFDQLERWFDWSSGYSPGTATRRKISKHGDCIRQPLSPLNGPVPFKDQIRSMLLHDSKMRVLLFGLWFMFKQAMDRVLRLGVKPPCMNRRRFV